MGGICLGELVEPAHYALHRQLKFAGDALEFGDCKDANERRRNQQYYGDKICRNEPGVGLKAEYIHRIFLVQHGVLHYFGYVLAVCVQPVGEDDPHDEGNHYQRHDAPSDYFFSTRFHIFFPK